MKQEALELYFYFCEKYGIDSFLDLDCQYLDMITLGHDEYLDMYRTDRIQWKKEMEDIFISNVKYIMENWESCKKGYLETLRHVARMQVMENVKGFKKLSNDYKILFSEFMENFLNRWEYPENHIPFKVRLKNDKSNGTYLRVDFVDGDWLHVKSASCWY